MTVRKIGLLGALAAASLCLGVAQASAQTERWTFNESKEIFTYTPATISGAGSLSGSGQINFTPTGALTSSPADISLSATVTGESPTLAALTNFSVTITPTGGGAPLFTATDTTAQLLLNNAGGSGQTLQATAGPASPAGTLVFGGSTVPAGTKPQGFSVTFQDQHALSLLSSWRAAGQGGFTGTVPELGTSLSMAGLLLGGGLLGLRRRRVCRA